MTGGMLHILYDADTSISLRAVLRAYEVITLFNDELIASRRHAVTPGLEVTVGDAVG
jgi:hypothetical protein